MVKNTYNLTLPPVKKLTMEKIIIYSIQGQCFMYNWRVGRRANVLTIREGFLMVTYRDNPNA